MSMATLNELKQEVFDYVRYSLGDGMVDVELDPQHYEQALKAAILRYRQRSSNSVEESYAFLDILQDTDTYTLPDEVISVKQIFRRSIGSTSTSSATQFEPFEAGFLNMYILQAGRVGGFLNYELFAQFQEMSQRMFGGFINFKFNKVSKQLQIIRRPRSETESVLLWTYNYKPDVTLLSDYKALPWLRDYTLALSKRSLGEAREKFATIAGPQGGTQLNGTALKSEAQNDIERLEKDIDMFVDGGDPMYFIIG
jgi:hypothetical protein